jgi:hypothetical protein
MAAFGKTNYRAIAIAFLVADIVSAMLFAAFTFLTDKSGLQGPGYAVILLLLGAQFSLMAIVVFALPLLFIFVRLRLVNIWSTLLSGLVVGAAMAGITEWPPAGISAVLNVAWDDLAVRRIYVFAVIGAVSALGFWLTWKQRSTDHVGKTL